MTQEQIASALGISERTLRSRKVEIADFADAIKRGKAKGIALVTNKLMESIKGGNMTGMIFFLKTQAGWKRQMCRSIQGRTAQHYKHLFLVFNL